MGAWIRPDGKWKFIPDHYEYIKAHPVEFGFKKKDPEGWGLGDRNAVIEKATERGWIRVRGTRPNLSMEFWRLDNNTIFNQDGAATHTAPQFLELSPLLDYLK